MERYISTASIRSVVDYFRGHSYTRPEQIGLFLYFKAVGLNEYITTSYERWGQMPASDRTAYTRVLFDLSSVFCEENETGLRRTALFPFSISNEYRTSSYYNGGTPFARLGSRIQDTLDNALVSTFIRRDNTNPSEYSFSEDYIQLLYDNYLRRSKIPLDFIASYYYRFWKICMPEGASDQDFADVCVLGFLKAFHISCNEFSGLFHYVHRPITGETVHITGTAFREMLGLDHLSDEIAPEIDDRPFLNVIPRNMTISEDEARNLLDLRGDNLDETRILEILAESDRVLQEQAAALNIAIETHRDYTREELLEMDDHGFIFSCLEMMSYHRLFNGYTLPILESREQCALRFRHHNIRGILVKKDNSIPETAMQRIVEDEAGNERYYTDTFSIAESEYYVSSVWSPDREYARGALIDWLMELLLTIRFETGIEIPFERNRIVFGAPGTGKSHLLKEDADDMLYNTSGTYERVTFHPEYTYSQFVGSYKPVTNAEGEIRYDFVPGPFMRVLVAALKSGRTDSPQPHLLLIEEINRAKVAAVFGDVFQLLDRNNEGSSEYEIHTTEDIRKYLISALGRAPESIKIPDNMFVWATMNSADQGVYPMDTAFKRRWNFEYIGIDDNDAEVGGTIELGTGDYRRTIHWNQLRKAINDTLSEEYGINEDKLLGPYFLSRSIFDYEEDGRMIDPDRFKDAFKSKIIMYLFEDAAKSVRHKLFNGCPNSRYSAICKAFDEVGIYIFGSDFVERYDRLEE